jgi:sigma-B regulation protein RsbU (phosphoserine phosphatase)
MKNEQQYPSGASSEKFKQTLTHLLTLTRLSEHDFVFLRDTAPTTQVWVDEFVESFHDTLLNYPPTAQLFSEDERPIQAALLRQWFLAVTRGDIDVDFWLRQWQLDMFYNLRRVKSPFTLGLMSHVQQWFLTKCLDAFEPAQALSVYGAFKRVTDVVTGLVIEAYHEGYGEMEKLVDDLENTILPLGIALSTERDLDRLMEKILIEVKSICNADAGTLYLREGDVLEFAIMLTDSLSIALGGSTGKTIPFPPLPLHDPATGEPNAHNVATHVALQGRSVNIPNVYDSVNFDFSATEKFDQENNYRSVSSLTVPLKNHEGEVIGVLQLFNALDPDTGVVTAFDSYQQLVVESLSSQAAVALSTKQMIERQEGFAKFERDLQIGHQIQVDFLLSPEELPQPDGWEIATFFQPAREVAGDFFDAFPLPGHKVGIVIADVVDKGVGAALFMALSRSLVRAFSQQHHPTRLLESLGDFDSPFDPTGSATRGRGVPLSAGIGALSAVKLTNEYIANIHGDMMMFATMFYGVLDPVRGTLHYINGGHDSPLLVGANGEIKTKLTPTGPAVGMMPDMDFEIGQIRIEPGDLLMTFSDGVTDARSPERDRFTPQRLSDLLTQAQPIPSAESLLSKIRAELQAHIDTADQFDDITMLAVWRKP